jgi:hypothetical protein
VNLCELFSHRAFYLSICQRIKEELGIKTAIADSDLSLKIINRVVETLSMFSSNPSAHSSVASFSPQDMARNMANMIRTSLDWEVSEEVDPKVRNWDARRDEPNTPPHWWARRPEDAAREGEYKVRNLWGWRTNLENSLRLGKLDRFKEICAAHTEEELSEYCNSRLLLNKFASEGRIGIVSCNQFYCTSVIILVYSRRLQSISRTRTCTSRFGAITAE